jgi:hypothetical protein
MADSSRYVLLPVERVGDSAFMNDEHLMRTAFARWRDVDVVGDADVARVLARHSSGSVAVDHYDDVGRDLRAGRIVRTTVAAHGDSVRVDAVMHDRAGRQMAAHSVRMARSEPRPDVHYARLADGLLFAGLWQHDRDPPGTDSRAAQTAYLTGLASIRDWDLVRADSLFTAATAADAQFARALAWLAQVEFWMHGATAAMRTAAEQAIAAAVGESSRARLMAESLLAMGRDDYPAACDRYERLLEGIHVTTLPRGDSPIATASIGSSCLTRRVRPGGGFAAAATVHCCIISVHSNCCPHLTARTAMVGS